LAPPPDVAGATATGFMPIRIEIQKLFENHTIFMFLGMHITWMMDIIV